MSSPKIHRSARLFAIVRPEEQVRACDTGCRVHLAQPNQPARLVMTVTALGPARMAVAEVA